MILKSEPRLIKCQWLHLYRHIWYNTMYIIGFRFTGQTHPNLHSWVSLYIMLSTWRVDSSHGLVWCTSFTRGAESADLPKRSSESAFRAWKYNIDTLWTTLLYETVNSKPENSLEVWLREFGVVEQVAPELWEEHGGVLIFVSSVRRICKYSCCENEFHGGH